MRDIAIVILRLDALFFVGILRRMDIQPDDIRRRAYDARVSINQLMKRAGMPNSTFWRWERGHIAKPHPITVGRICDALDAIEREQAR